VSDAEVTHLDGALEAQTSIAGFADSRTKLHLSGFALAVTVLF